MASRKAAAAAVAAHVAVLKGRPLRAALSEALAKAEGLGGNERRFVAFCTRELSRHLRWLDRAAKEAGHAPSSFHLEEDRAVMRYALWRRFRLGAEAAQVMREVSLPGPVRPRSVPDAVVADALGKAVKVPEDEPALAHSFPTWLAEAIGSPQVMEALNREPRIMMKVRPNGTRDEVQALLAAKGITTAKVEGVADALVLEDDGRAIFESGPMKNGRLVVMDVGSQRIVELCGLKGGETVIDFCAGAGGKTIALADAVGEHGRVLAWDKSQKRLAEAKERTHKLKLRHVSFPLELRMDDAQLVLIDAPCSGTGSLAREPDQKWKLTPEAVKDFAKTQGAILDEVSKKAPQAVLVYATCSVLKAEDEEVVEAFVKRSKRYTLEASMRVWPQESEGAGFYAARLTPLGRAR
ncbi:MAG: class I SAM-dependent methyltransferase [Archangiaceae bacterium]|nr:class I SAM-dependent methyltransferase [Archangiaceae bacterium]